MSTSPLLAVGTTLAAGALVSPSSLHPLRRGLLQLGIGARRCGVSVTPHVALTFDDGPDRTSTPLILEALRRYGVRATFFVLGRHLGSGGLLREMSAEGHEVGVHGWDHRPAPLRPPRSLADDLRRTRDLVEDLTGKGVSHYRPPYGASNAASARAVHRTGLETVLWTAWGRDWEARATPASVASLVSSQLSPGGTVLLHDSDRTSAPGSWRSTLGALDVLLPTWAHAGLRVGPLREHWVG